MREFENHIQWSAVKEVCARLRREGFIALLAGGCVRDLIMQRQPNDFDVATDATPGDAARIFPNALTVGREFGVTIVPFEGFQIEVATFREDLEYKDGRRPEGVRFSNPEQDARRRDFTINALFYDLNQNQVIDFVGGQEDIGRRLIRTVGDPDQRFAEDQLRLLRAVRFSAQLEFDLAPATLEAVVRLHDRVKNVSRERVRDEILKLLKAPARRRGLELLLSTGLLESLFPRLAEAVFTEETDWIRRFELADQKGLVAQLALFFFPEYARVDERVFRDKELKELRLDGRTIEAVLFSLRNRERLLDPDRTRRGELVLTLAHPEAHSAEELAWVFECDRSGPNAADALSARWREIAEQSLGRDRERPEPILTGAIAKSAGLLPGPRMGELLHEAFLLQLEGKLHTETDAIDWLKRQSQS